jgi:hypothetical protein
MADKFGFENFTYTDHKYVKEDDKVIKKRIIRMHHSTVNRDDDSVFKIIRQTITRIEVSKTSYVFWYTQPNNADEYPWTVPTSKESQDFANEVANEFFTHMDTDGYLNLPVPLDIEMENVARSYYKKEWQWIAATEV